MSSPARQNGERGTETGTVLGGQDKGSLSPWELWQRCHGAGGGSSRAQGAAGQTGNTRGSAEKTSPGPRCQPRPEGGTRAAARSRPGGNRSHRPSPGISRPWQGVLRKLQVAEAVGSHPALALPPCILLDISV